MCECCNIRGDVRTIHWSDTFNISSDLCKMCFMKTIVTGKIDNVKLNQNYWVAHFESIWESAKVVK
jgi:hypothetical protein